MKKKLMVLIPTLSLVVSTTAVAKRPFEKQDCVELSNILTQNFKGQLPIDIDYATQLNGINAIYFSNKCNINYVYYVNLEAIISVVAREQELSYDDTKAWFVSDKGVQLMTNETKKTAKDIGKHELVSKLKDNYKHWTLNATYIFDMDEYSTITLKILEQ